MVIWVAPTVIRVRFRIINRNRTGAIVEILLVPDGLPKEHAACVEVLKDVFANVEKNFGGEVEVATWRVGLEVVLVYGYAVVLWGALGVTRPTDIHRPVPRDYVHGEWVGDCLTNNE